MTFSCFYKKYPTSMKNLLYIWWVSRDLFHSLYSYKNLQSGPMVVHCSAGIGRSGAFIVCDMICDLIKKNGPQCIINIKDAVKHCRLVNVNQTSTDRLVDRPDMMDREIPEDAMNWYKKQISENIVLEWFKQKINTSLFIGRLNITWIK